MMFSDDDDDDDAGDDDDDVLSALLIRAMRAADIRHRRLVRRRTAVLSSASRSSPRTDIQTCTTVRRHHTFEEPRTPGLNGDMLQVSPSAWKRSYSERITRSPAQSAAMGAAIHLGKRASITDAIQDDPDI